jgi:hypothetical protein
MPWATREVPPGSGRWRAVNEPARPHPGAAPAFDCADCGRHIGKRATRYLVPVQRVLCGRCADRRGLWDDLTAMGSRAGIAARLGLWPRKAPR